MYHHLDLTLAQADNTPLGDPQTGPAADTQQADPGNESTVPPNDKVDPEKQGQGDGPFPTGMILMIGVMAVLFWMMIAGPRKEKKRRAQMLGALHKGDRVQTIGGIIGTIAELREHEVVVKVDENANTRLVFSRGAVQQVLQGKGDAAEVRDNK